MLGVELRESTMRCGAKRTAPYTPDGLSSRTTPLSAAAAASRALSPELLDPNESLLLPLEPLSDPGPWCLLQLRRTRVGELSLDVVSGALLSMAAIPTGRTKMFIFQQPDVSQCGVFLLSCRSGSE